MGNLSKFKSKVSADKKLQKRINDASTIKDVAKIAASVGCPVTENEIRDDMMEVISGGEGMGNVNTNVTTGDNTIKFYENIKKEALLTQNATGAGSVASNSGNISIS